MLGNPITGFIGGLLILLITYDAIQTTLSASNSGPLSRRLIRIIWAPFLFLHHRRKSHAMLNAIGPWCTLSLLLLWVSVLWLGWFLLFSSSPQAVVNSTSQVTATLIERAYFIGYTITTLGYGDFAPGNGKWQLLATVAAGNGLFLFTLAITYIVPVVAATVQKRQCALLISSLGNTPWQIIHATQDDDFDSLAQRLSTLETTIAALGQQHLAYPILHYYHSEHVDSALPVAIARLYQTLCIVLFACPHLRPTTRAQLLGVQHTLDQFLKTLGSAFIHPAEAPPALPELADYARLTGIDKRSDELDAHLGSLAQQRLLLAFVEKDGWHWHDVWQDRGARPLPVP